MKKKIIITIVTLASAISFGDVIAINWNNTGGTVGNFAFDATIPNGTYAALIWSASVPTLADELLLTGISTTPGLEYLLNSTTTTSAGGGFAIGSGLPYVDADVGDVNINSGYFFTRIFDSSSPENGTFYYAQGGITGPVLENSGNPPDPTKTYSDSVFSATTLGQTNNAYTVVPEPATIGLFGLGALSTWIVRRNKRKATEEA